MRERSIVFWIIISVVTFGIGGIVWFVKITDDAVRANDGQEYSTSGGAALLFTLITLGFYGWYWYYKMGKALYIAKKMRGMPSEDRSILYLILGLVGVGFISVVLMQDELNDMAKLEKTVD